MNSHLVPQNIGKVGVFNKVEGVFVENIE